MFGDEDEVLKYKVEIDSEGIESQIQQLKSRLDLAFMNRTGIDPSNPFTSAFNSFTNKAFNKVNNFVDGFGASGSNYNDSYMSRQMAGSNFASNQHSFKTSFMNTGFMRATQDYMQNSIWIDDNQTAGRFSEIRYEAREKLNREMDKTVRGIGAFALDIAMPFQNVTDMYTMKTRLGDNLHAESQGLVTSLNSTRAMGRGLTFGQSDAVVSNAIKGMSNNFFSGDYWKAQLTGRNSEGVSAFSMMDRDDVEKSFNDLMQSGGLTGSRNIQEITKKTKEFLRTKLDNMRRLQIEDDQAYAEFIAQQNSLGSTNIGQIKGTIASAEMASRTSGISTMDIIRGGMNFGASNAGSGISAPGLQGVFANATAAAGIMFNSRGSGISNNVLQQLGGITGLSQLYANNSMDFANSQFGEIYQLARSQGYTGSNLMGAMGAASGAFGSAGNYYSAYGKLGRIQEEMFGDFSGIMNERSAIKAQMDAVGANFGNKDQLVGFLKRNMNKTEQEAIAIAERYANPGTEFRGLMDERKRNMAKDYIDEINEGVFNKDRQSILFHRRLKTFNSVAYSTPGMGILKGNVGLAAAMSFFGSASESDVISNVDRGIDFDVSDTLSASYAKLSIKDKAAITRSQGRIRTKDRSGWFADDVVSGSAADVIGNLRKSLAGNSFLRDEILTGKNGAMAKRIAEEGFEVDLKDPMLKKFAQAIASSKNPDEMSMEEYLGDLQGEDKIMAMMQMQRIKSSFQDYNRTGNLNALDEVSRKIVGSVAAQDRTYNYRTASTAISNAKGLRSRLNNNTNLSNSSFASNLDTFSEASKELQKALNTGSPDAIKRAQVAVQSAGTTLYDSFAIMSESVLGEDLEDALKGTTFGKALLATKNSGGNAESFNNRIRAESAVTTTNINIDPNAIAPTDKTMNNLNSVLTTLVAELQKYNNNK